MSTTYAQRQTTAQKKDANTAASVVDSSSQGESLQRKADMANNAAQRAEAPRPNNTGMPDNLKAGIESLSGFSMDDVRVHYNSSKPATVQALAYTQGTDIHVAPGQEKHLPHEAWHVAQQMAGRVSPTTNINGMPVNDNAALEHEADVMGAKAVAQRKNIIQREVPQNVDDQPPIPQTGRYIARSGKDEIYFSKEYPRTHFNFGEYTREDVFSMYPHTRMGNRFITVRDDKSGQQVNVEGIQLDHIQSWDNISNIMDLHNNKKLEPLLNPNSGGGRLQDLYNNHELYTFYDAKMYYNDISNLHPVLGGLNAAAGNAGVPKMQNRNEIIDQQIADIQLHWMNLQNCITAYYEGNLLSNSNGGNLIYLWIILEKLKNNMISSLDSILP